MSPLGQSGESHFINLSYLECIFYGPQCGCKKWQGTFKSKINCFSIQIIVFCVGRDRNTNTQGMRSQETHIASSTYLTFSSSFNVFAEKYSFYNFQEETTCSSCVRRGRRSSSRSWCWWTWPASRCMCGDSRRRFRNGFRIRVSRAETGSRIISAAVYFKRDKVLSDTQWSIKVMISSFAVISRNVNPGVGRVTVR